METSGNLDTLVEHVLERARQEAAAIVDRGKRAAEREVGRAREQLDGRKHAAADALREAAGRRERSARAEAEQDKRRAVMNAREAAVESVFDEALHTCQAIGEPAQRMRLLQALAQEGIRAVAASPVRVRLNAAERELSPGLPKEIDGVPVTLDAEPIETAGGPVVTDESGRVIFENTFEARLDRMREPLRRLVAETLCLEDGQGRDP